MEKRERRRWLTERAARRKQYIYRTRCWIYTVGGRTINGPPSPELLEQLPLLGRLRKGKSIGCNCRHRLHGQPKISGGSCYHLFRPAVLERARGRRFCQQVTHAVRAGLHPDDIE